MTRHRRILWIVGGLVALVAILAVACGGAAAPAQAPRAATGGVSLAAHKAGETHQFAPKRLEAFIEIDMNEYSIANPQGERDPTFKLPAGKTVGIHIHNEGAIVHELVIGRKAKATADGFEYTEILSEKVPSDLFFYYGNVKAEVGDALFKELEIEAGVRDVWMRLNIPAELKGEWEFGCFVKGHYEQGMKARLIVE